MDGRRVVVTGLGVLAPGGANDVATFWRMALASTGTLAGPITAFDASQFSTTFACEVKGYDPEAHFSRKDLRSKDKFVQYAQVAAREAVTQARLNGEGIDRDRCGVIFGSGIGGIGTLEEQHKRFLEKGPGRISPFLCAMMLSNLAAGEIAIEHGLRGVNKSQCTACATGNHAIGDAFDCIRWGKADLMIAGGSEAALTPMGFGGFCSIHALSKQNADPTRASCPFDVRHDGFVMGEGAGAVVLEALDHARQRGATILAEIVGYGATDDAYHITAPVEGGAGLARAMQLALADANLQPADIDYINAHGTSTPVGDPLEVAAIKTVCGDHARQLVVSSTKSTFGHLLGATAAVELVACVKAIGTGIIPPTVNLDQPDLAKGCDLNFAPLRPVEKPVRVAMNNSLGFGGHNASLIVKQFAD